MAVSDSVVSDTPGAGSSAWGDVRMLALFGAAVLLFILAQVSLLGLNGLWIDELFSLWAADPVLPVAQNFSERIIVDSNPPLYFTLLRLVRGAVDDPRTAFLVLDGLALVLTLGFALWTANRAGAVRLGLAAGAVFLLGGAALCYFPEGRSYFVAMCVVFAASWLALLETLDESQATLPPRIRLIGYGVLGVLASLAHVYSGIFAGCLAAGLIAGGLLARKRAMMAAGLLLGGAATIMFALWFTKASAYLGNVSWIAFTPQAVRDAIWLVRTLAVGPAFMLLPLAAALGFGVAIRSARPLLLVFAVTFLLFIVIPVAISFSTPIISGRYWAVGAPALGVLLAGLGRAYLMSGHRYGRPAAIGVGVAAIAMAGFGYLGARKLTAEKPVWRGGEVVAELARECPAGSVRVQGDPVFLPGFALASGLPEALFTPVVAGEAEDVLASRCPVFAWAEHVQQGAGFVMSASDAELLALVGLKAQPGDANVVRHDSGFVVTDPGER